MPKLATLLKQSEQNVAEGERLVAEQRQEIKEMKQRGEDAYFYECVLREMEASLHLMHQSQQALQEEMSVTQRK